MKIGVFFLFKRLLNYSGSTAYLTNRVRSCYCKWIFEIYCVAINIYVYINVCGVCFRTVETTFNLYDNDTLTLSASNWIITHNKGFIFHFQLDADLIDLQVKETC